MHEIEIKFQVSPAQRSAVDAAVAGRAPPARTRLQAAYHDTAERTLAKAGLALRLRREGRLWVQTLKGATDDSITRLEHNVPRGRAAAMPPVDPQLHAATPVGEALLALLAGRDAPALAVVYRTDIRRRARALRTPQGRVELAFDAGSIHAGDRKAGVLELEIELLGGSPRAVFDTARRWLARFDLWLDVRGKAERGDLLARGASIAPPRLASAVRLTPQMTAAQAWQAVLRSCTDQITANASQIASGEHGDEHVHQLRVGLRRLRSALRLFDGLGADAALAEPAATLFRRLGSARDQVVIEGEFAAGLLAAMRAAGVAGDAPVAAPAHAHVPPTEVLRERSSQTLLLKLLAACHAPGTDASQSERQRDSEGERSVVADPSARVHDRMPVPEPGPE
ncbi:MAG: CYTH domain-containing protein, partial [Burkholderiales bacterium]|nr:CYTH domain-containing protein [Burkholderiales bacterium]